MDIERLAIAFLLAIGAAVRLIFWQRYVKRDREWLAKMFGASEDDEAIAQANSFVWACGLALAALFFAYD